MTTLFVGSRAILSMTALRDIFAKGARSTVPLTAEALPGAPPFVRALAEKSRLVVERCRRETRIWIKPCGIDVRLRGAFVSYAQRACISS